MILAEAAAIEVPAIAASAVKRAHLRAADEDYIAARICAFVGLVQPLYNLSALAIEKVLKTIIFLHGGNVDSTHNLPKLSTSAQSVAKFDAASFLEDVRLNGQGAGFMLPRRSTDQFLTFLSQQGSATARYGGHGFLTQSQDLICLDNLYLRLRRLCVVLDARFPDPNQVDGERVDDPTKREWLQDNPLEMTAVVGCFGDFHSLGSEQAEFLLRDNILLSKSDVRISNATGSISGYSFKAENSIFGMLFEEKPDPEAYEALKYLLKAYPFRSDDKREIETALTSWFNGSEETP